MKKVELIVGVCVGLIAIAALILTIHNSFKLGTIRGRNFEYIPVWPYGRSIQLKYQVQLPPTVSLISGLFGFLKNQQFNIAGIDGGWAMGEDILCVDINVYNDSLEDYEFLELVVSHDKVHVQLYTGETNEVKEITNINDFTDGLLSRNVMVDAGQQHLIVRLPVGTKQRNDMIFCHWLTHAEHEGWQIKPNIEQKQYIEYCMQHKPPPPRIA